MERKPNRLATEKSPYLLKHAFNPVDWYTWGKEALAKSKNDNKPILLSIGYSTCHWCTVMERESFEDEKTAAFMNKHFISIKVDREERPEVDAYYMGAVQAMTGGGGWPLTVFLTPDLKPFYGGTYFPPEPRFGMPSFMQVLEFVVNLWKDRREEVTANSEQVTKAIGIEAREGKTELKRDTLDEGYASLVSNFDSQYGGFGGAPKFPLPNSLAFLLRYHFRTGKELALTSVLKTLDEMMAGGIRDHVGGGFHRYSTDRTWLVPHFEKMLYDNALLARVYAEAYQLTLKAEYAEVVRETLGWMMGELRDKEGGFYSAQDADTAEGEGVFYTWTPEELEKVLGSKGGQAFAELYGVTRTGNFEGRSILRLDPSAGPGSEQDDFVHGSKRKLYLARRKRPLPATDSKVMTSWNGLAVSALANASAVFGDKSYAATATQAADFVLRKISEDGRLLRRYAGGEAAFAGTLEDYAFFVQGLLDLFEATSEPRWLGEAVRLTRTMMAEYEDKGVGGYFLSLDAEPARLKESYDGPTPSGNSVAALDLIRLFELTGDEGFRKSAERTLTYFGKDVERQPSAHAFMLAAADLLVNGAREVVITASTAKGAAELRSEAFRPFLPDKVVLIATSDTFEELSGLSTLLEGRKPAAKARAYVCRGFTCNLPVESAEALRAQLSER